jgi:hypothetical protein
MAKNSKRRAWTPEQVRTLKTLAKKKTHEASIAKTLKRTVGATRQKAFSMGCHSTRGPEFRDSKLYGDTLPQAPPLPYAGRFFATSYFICSA